MAARWFRDARAGGWADAKAGFAHAQGAIGRAWTGSRVAEDYLVHAGARAGARTTRAAHYACLFEELGAQVRSYPSSTNLYQVSYHIQ